MVENALNFGYGVGLTEAIEVPVKRRTVNTIKSKFKEVLPFIFVFILVKLIMRGALSDIGFLWTMAVAVPFIVGYSVAVAGILAGIDLIRTR